MYTGGCPCFTRAGVENLLHVPVVMTRNGKGIVVPSLEANSGRLST